jgi:tetratricopeptide (TPR) repeat protein
MRIPNPVESFASVLALGCVLGFGGCASDGDSAGSEALTGAGPAETAWMDKHARFNAAIEGVAFDTGVVVVTQPLEGDFDEAMRLRAEGMEHYSYGRYIEATASHVRAVRMVPEFAEAYFSLGEAVLGHGKVDLAAAAHRTAIALDPQFTDPRFHLAMALWMMGESDQAILEMEEVVAQDPQRAEAHERLAIWNYYGGDDAAAWRHVHAARGLGHEMPGQFIALLEARTPDPGMPNR